VLRAGAGAECILAYWTRAPAIRLRRAEFYIGIRSLSPAKFRSVAVTSFEKRVNRADGRQPETMR
jgi:hypothetical protein